jgi:DNA-binding transcriptional LysR family regulator
MDTKQLQYFLTICKKKSLSKAAEDLYISQQALSSSISHLENELGCRLFVRSSTGVKPTPEGMYFKIQASKMLELHEQTIQHLADFHHELPNLTVGSAYGIIGEMSDLLLNKYRLNQEDIHLKIIEYQDLDCEQAVLHESVDLGLAIGPIRSSKLDTIPLITRRYTFIVHRSHPLAQYETISLEQLANENIIMMNSKFQAHQLLNTLSRQKGIKLQYAYECGEIAPIQQLVLNQYGIGISTDFESAHKIHPDLKTLYLDEPDYLWAVYLITKKQTSLSPVCRRFIEYMSSVAAPFDSIGFGI